MERNARDYRVTADHNGHDGAFGCSERLFTVVAENIDGVWVRRVSARGYGHSRDYRGVDDNGAIRNFLQEHDCRVINVWFA